MVPQRIKEEIVTKRLVLSNLATQRHPPPFVFRLPIEILEAIFIHCARDYHHKAFGIPACTPSWVNVSYVCRHWRNVALNCPILWTYLFPMSPRWTEELLARSKQVTLKLYLNFVYLDIPTRQLLCDILEPLMNHIKRIQELRLQCTEMHDDAELNLFFSGFRTCPFHVRHMENSSEGYTPEHTSVFFDVPALRTLELSCCPVPWPLLKLNGLTTLSLRCTLPRFQQNMADFLSMLNCMQDLIRIYLCNALSSASGFLSSSAFNDFQKFRLPKLSRLLITAPLSAVIVLLSCVDIPLKTVVRLECHDDGLGSHVSDYVFLLPSLLAQRFGMSSPTIRSLGIRSAEWEKATLAFSTSEHDYNFDISRMEWVPNIPLWVIIFFGPTIPRCVGDHIIGDICNAMPLTNVQSVHVLDPPSSLAFWRHALGNLPDLRLLKLSSGIMSDVTAIFSILSLEPHDCTENVNQSGYTDCLEGPRPDRVLFAPALEEFEMRKILFLSPPTESDVRSLYRGLCTVTRGRLTLTQHASTKYGSLAKFDMVWKLEIGHACGVESATSSS